MNKYIVELPTETVGRNRWVYMYRTQGTVVYKQSKKTQFDDLCLALCHDLGSVDNMIIVMIGICPVAAQT
jgi:hypothetical protein